MPYNEFTLTNWPREVDWWTQSLLMFRTRWASNTMMVNRNYTTTKQFQELNNSKTKVHEFLDFKEKHTRPLWWNYATKRKIDWQYAKSTPIKKSKRGFEQQNNQSVCIDSWIPHLSRSSNHNPPSNLIKITLPTWCDSPSTDICTRTSHFGNKYTNCNGIKKLCTQNSSP